MCDFRDSTASVESGASRKRFGLRLWPVFFIRNNSVLVLKIYAFYVRCNILFVPKFKTGVVQLVIFRGD